MLNGTMRETHVRLGRSSMNWNLKENRLGDSFINVIDSTMLIFEICIEGLLLSVLPFEYCARLFSNWFGIWHKLERDSLHRGLYMTIYGSFSLVM